MDDAKARLYVAIHHHGAGKHADGPYPQTIIAIQGAVYHQDFFGFRMVGAAQYFVLLAFVMLVNATGNVVHNDFVWIGVVKKASCKERLRCCACSAFAQAAVVHATKTGLVLHLAARVLGGSAACIYSWSRVLHHGSGRVAYGWAHTGYTWPRLLCLRPCDLGLWPVWGHVRTWLLRRWANHIACEWRAHLWPCTRGWTGGLVLWSRYLVSGE